MFPIIDICAVDSNADLFATRWAAKEAAHKALSPLDLALSPKSYILDHLPSGRPILQLDLEPEAKPDRPPYLLSSPFPTALSDAFDDSLRPSRSPKNTLESLRLITSISHDAGIVTAIVIAGLGAEEESL